MKWMLALLILSGCAMNSLPDNPYQKEAIKTFAHYNSVHHLNIAVPMVYVGATEGPYAGTTTCKSVCIITLNEVRSVNMEQTLIHEEAHAICMESSPDCHIHEHGITWQKIALELGLDNRDSYITAH